MNPSQKNRNSISHLIRYRDEIMSRVSDNTNIVGSMIGRKITKNEITDDVALTIFVKKKKHKSEMVKKDLIPREFKIEGKTIVSDVLQNKTVKDHAVLTYDGRSSGTLSCFGINTNGVYGVTCAHCLLGVDGIPSTPSEIQAYVDGQLTTVGNSVNLLYSSGLGTRLDYGFLDCGTFVITDPRMRSQVAKRRRARFVEKIGDLLGVEVRGESWQRDGVENSFERNGCIVGIMQQIGSMRSDLILSVKPPGTYAGDSGMLWRDYEGRIAGIHARGDVSTTGSIHCAAMFGKRAALGLGVDFVE